MCEGFPHRLCEFELRTYSNLIDLFFLAKVPFGGLLKEQEGISFELNSAS